MVDDLVDLFAELHRHQTAAAPSLIERRARPATEAWERRRRHYQDCVKDGQGFFVVARSRGAVVAYALVSLAAGYDGWGPDAPIGEIKDLVVAPARRRAGLATSLLEAVKTELLGRGVDTYRLNVIAGNDTARTFYERHGLVLLSVVLGGPNRAASEPMSEIS